MSQFLALVKERHAAMIAEENAKAKMRDELRRRAECAFAPLVAAYREVMSLEVVNHRWHESGKKIQLYQSCETFSSTKISFYGGDGNSGFSISAEANEDGTVTYSREMRNQTVETTKLTISALQWFADYVASRLPKEGTV